MDNFSAFLKEERGEPNIEGVFDCYECELSAEGAYYDANNKTLRWYCPNGHVSIIEEFQFG